MKFELRAFLSYIALYFNTTFHLFDISWLGVLDTFIGHLLLSLILSAVMAMILPSHEEVITPKKLDQEPTEVTSVIAGEFDEIILSHDGIWKVNHGRKK